MKVSIITPHKDDQERLTGLFLSLKEQTFNLDEVEWIVVDDGSSGKLPDWLSRPIAQSGLSVRLVELGENRGRAAARNAGIRASSGEIVVFLDADMIAERQWLEYMVRAVDKTGSVIVGRLQSHPELKNSAFLKYYHSRGAAKHKRGAKVPGKYFVASTSALPSQMVKAVDGYDESFSSWGGEDLELGLRLEKAGASFYFEPKSLVYHYHNINWTSTESRYQDYARKTVPALIAKHPEAFGFLSLSRIANQDGNKPSLVQKLYLQALKPFFYTIAKVMVTSLPSFPWPDLIFDYMIFYLYSETFREQTEN